MRAVVDTNVFISAALKDASLPAMAVRLVQQRYVLLKSVETERQLFDVLARPYFASLVAPATVARFRQILSAAELVLVTERIAACRDPTDDKFLDLAVSGRAAVIVSGDADLLALHPFRGVPILSPATFLRTAAASPP